MTTRIPGNYFGDRAARLAGVTLLAAAVGLAGATPGPADAPIADRGVPRQAPAPAPGPPAAPAQARTVPLGSLPVADPIEFTRSGGANGVPASVLAAYQNAAAALAVTQPGCGLRPELLAAIGRVESGHARGGQVDAAGTTLTPILGPVLSGQHGFAAVADTDGGRLDGNRVWDRAVGPMQFIPGTWARWAVDGNGDGVADPHNVYDASRAAGDYLCAGDRDLRTPAGLDEAILSYNQSPAYLRLVLAWFKAYTLALAAIPDDTGPLAPPDTVVPADEVALAPGAETPLPPQETPGAAAPPVAGTPPPSSPPPTPAPPVPPTAPAPTAPAPGPVQTLVCVVGGVLTGLGSLLGAPPPDDCD
ncbi:lytic transglycosylase domain-containing protein [Actinophytocola sp.]|uniref:lytic transglycosylase domain-containing protein n=1 Tax=Actinophytocola sp. TaxID=1872138 RepID=UPI00389A8B5E